MSHYTCQWELHYLFTRTLKPHPPELTPPISLFTDQKINVHVWCARAPRILT